MVCRECDAPVRAKGLCAAHYMKERRVSNPEHARAIQRTSYAKRRQEVLARNYEWRQANKSAVRVTKAAWNAAHPEKVLEAKRKWRKANPEKSRAAVAAWGAAHPDLNAAKVAARNARKLMATPRWSDIDAIKRIYAAASAKRKETGRTWHVDHIVPLKSPLVCGLHVEHNLQVIPGPENNRKGNWHWPDMP